MKFLLVTAVIVQLCLADETNINVVQAPNDKLRPIFELIATKMQEYNKKHYTWLDGVVKEILPEYKKFVDTHDTKEYEDLKEAIEKFLITVEQFEKDPDNCQFQRAAYIDVVAAAEKQPDDDNLHKFFQNVAMVKHINLKDDNTVILEICAEFPDLIKNFIESLNEEEKQEYAELYGAGEKILKTPEGKERFGAIESFIRETHYEEHLTEANDENCKWDLSNFEIFVKKVWYKSLDLE